MLLWPELSERPQRCRDRGGHEPNAVVPHSLPLADLPLRLRTKAGIKMSAWSVAVDFMLPPPLILVALLVIPMPRCGRLRLRAPSYAAF